MEKFKIKDEYITLGQFLKYCNAVSSGVEAKVVILEGYVSVNGEVEKRRGKKLRSNDQIEFGNKIYCIE
ncbi:S4 domain-containing protein YaaA [Tannockella kyphosi]|uniref:S4 domain-containing protein YaaA n=1 Tax=Tannockella kyphosi TaxID=2899121 RepID=UPI002012E969|nr:S4 domain-containing protein YaaA [Tannockella kyphosi]